MPLPPFPNLRPSELACHDGTPYPEEWPDRWLRLGSLFQAIRTRFGKPLHVVSGYRSPKWNKRLIREDRKRGAHGVASGSLHIEGKALDIRTTNKLDLPVLFRIIMAMYENGELRDVNGKELLGGIAMYPLSNWIHIDTFVPADGHLRKWRGT